MAECSMSMKICSQSKAFGVSSLKEALTLQSVNQKFLQNSLPSTSKRFVFIYNNNVTASNVNNQQTYCRRSPFQ